MTSKLFALPLMLTVAIYSITGCQYKSERPSMEQRAEVLNEKIKDLRSDMFCLHAGCELSFDGCRCWHTDKKGEKKIVPKRCLDWSFRNTCIFKDGKFYQEATSGGCGR